MKHKRNISISKKGKPSRNKCKIHQFDLNDKFIREWDSMSEASNKLGISQGNISMCCRGDRSHASGYKWKYKQLTE